MNSTSKPLHDMTVAELAATGWASGSMPVVSTACMASTIEKKPLIWASMRPLSSGLSSSRARLAIRSISWGVRDLSLIHI